MAPLRRPPPTRTTRGRAKSAAPSSSTPSSPTRLLRLGLVRHAKSSWKDAGLLDRHRGLAPRGNHAAKELAGLLATRSCEPVDVIVSSDAARAVATAAALHDAFPEARLSSEHPAVYDAAVTGDGAETVAAVRAALAAAGDGARSALVVGHNYGWEAAVEELSGVKVELKTANAAILELEEEEGWETALRRTGEWTLREVVRARSKAELKAAELEGRG